MRYNIYEAKFNLNPSSITSVFSMRSSEFINRRVKNHGLNTLSYNRPKIWASLPSYIKNAN